MRITNKSAIAALMTLWPAGAVMADILPPTHERCAANGFVGVAEGIERKEWGLRCMMEKSGFVSPYIAGDAWFDIGAYFNDYLQLSNADREAVFPVYYSANFSGDWPAPNNRNTSCDVLPNTYSMFGLCWSGCYTPEMMVEFSHGSVPIQLAQQKGYVDLITLAPESTLDNLNYMTNEVQSYTADSVAQHQTIYKITTKSGASLSVTHEHPLLDNNGVMRDAQNLKVGDSLVRKDGTPDAIIQIEKTDYFGKVYNVDPTTIDTTTNIVVAQGFLSGSRRYQGPYRDMINSVILRRALADDFVAEN